MLEVMRKKKFRGLGGIEELECGLDFEGELGVS